MTRKKQTRRAISVKGLTYQRMQKYCREKGMSVAGFVEELVAEKLAELGVPEEILLEPRVKKPEKPVDPETIPSAHFTF
jgi:hypothetical protein